MEVKIMFVKLEGTKRIEIPYSEMKKEEREAQGLDLKKRFFESFGYTPVKTA